VPTAPRRPCASPGCPEPAIAGSGRCARHAAEQAARWERNRVPPNVAGYDSVWRRTRARFLRLHPYCVACGAEATDVHHVLPLRMGGTNDEENLEPLCHSCHSRHTDAHDGGWGNR
jgi:5-methylcytosine-specific restriction enzyme A